MGFTLSPSYSTVPHTLGATRMKTIEWKFTKFCQVHPDASKNKKALKKHFRPWTGNVFTKDEETFLTHSTGSNIPDKVSWDSSCEKKNAEIEQT